MKIEAEATVPASAEAVFEFLADLENHWELADRFIEVVSLEREALDKPARGGRVRMHGPLGTRRTTTTRVVTAEPHRSLSGTVELSGGTRARVHWGLMPDVGATRVRLSAELERSALLDRLLLAAGGRIWLRRRFEAILEVLAGRFAANQSSV
jgi:hypothetical protein